MTMQLLKTKSKPKETSYDERFTVYNNGIVYDTNTNLEWFAGPDNNTTWDKAREWVDNLYVDGGNWRMPTINELRSLYKAGAGSRNITPLLKTTGWYVWSGETKDSLSAYYLYFDVGSIVMGNRNDDRQIRVFAVRSRKNKE